MPRFGTCQRLQGYDYRLPRLYFVTICTKAREPVFRDPRLAAIAKATIVDYRQRNWYWLLAFCVMPNHIHALLKLRDAGRPLPRVIASIKNQISYRARQLCLRVSFQWGFHDRIIRAHEKPDEFAKYIISNPVRAGLVNQPADYKFGGIVDSWY